MDQLNISGVNGAHVDHRPCAARMVQHAYQASQTLPDLLARLMREAARQAKWQAAVLSVPGSGVLAVACQGQDISATWHEGEAGIPRISGAMTHHALTYAELQLGSLRIWWSTPDELAHPRTEWVEDLLHRCGHLIRRQDAHQWSCQHLGKSALLVGLSEALYQLETFVEKASQCELPVLIHGEFGTEKSLVAQAIHCHGPHKDGVFIEVNGAAPSGPVSQWFEQARHGTLFFNGIDELPLGLQCQLPAYLHARQGRRLELPDAQAPRVIASTTSDLHQAVRETRFPRALLAELDFLNVHLPPLRSRVTDIDKLVMHALRRHGHDPERKCTDDLLALCKAYRWPENLHELERVIARLAVMTGSAPIGRADVLRHAPCLLDEQVCTVDVAQDASDEIPLRPDGPDGLDGAIEPSKLDHWVQCTIGQRWSEVRQLHCGVRKAMLFLGEHHVEPITLGQLAQHAHLSPSHLSFLFRTQLQTAFKPFLQRLRVEKAKALLRSDPLMRITHVALQVGFADLSHFEKSFRRITGQSPRAFRQGQVT